MKLKTSAWLIIIGLFLFSAPLVSVAQSYHRLAARDFAGTPPTDEGFVAYTNCYVSYSYQPTRHNGIYNIDFDVRLYLNNNKSWIRFNQLKSREMLLNVLRHEQGHYNIAYLMRNELYSAFNHQRYTANYQAEISRIFKRVEAKYHQLNDDYENETQHMTHTQNQEKWDNWFSKQLDNAAIAGN